MMEILPTPLPSTKHQELKHIVSVILRCFGEATKNRKALRLRAGKILKIVLFGSYARGDWVEDPVGRYFSDFDLLVVVSDEDLVDLDFWKKAESELLKDLVDGVIRTPVSIIVHSIADVNWKLEHGRPFFVDIVNDGMTLFTTDEAVLSRPQPLDADIALSEAESHFADALETSDQRAIMAVLAQEKGFLKISAFELHQAVEALYVGTLLVKTQYSPRVHNLVRLRKMTEPLIPQLHEVWTGQGKFEKRAFELLRAAYVKARYSNSYRITIEELNFLHDRRNKLRSIVYENLSGTIDEMRRVIDR